MIPITLESFQNIKRDQTDLLLATQNAYTLMQLITKKCADYGNISISFDYSNELTIVGYKKESSNSWYTERGNGCSGVYDRPYTHYSQIRTCLFSGNSEALFIWLCN